MDTQDAQRYTASVGYLPESRLAPSTASERRAGCPCVSEPRLLPQIHPATPGHSDETTLTLTAAIPPAPPAVGVGLEGLERLSCMLGALEGGGLLQNASGGCGATGTVSAGARAASQVGAGVGAEAHTGRKHGDLNLSLNPNPNPHLRELCAPAEDSNLNNPNPNPNSNPNLNPNPTKPAPIYVCTKGANKICELGVFEICSFLQPSELLRASEINRRWHAATRVGGMWFKFVPLVWAGRTVNVPHVAKGRDSDPDPDPNPNPTLPLP